MPDRSYTPDVPLTGFTLTLDGDPEAVEAILKAAMYEMERQFRRAERERKPFDSLLTVGYYLAPSYPVHGEVRLRTWP